VQRLPFTIHYSKKEHATSTEKCHGEYSRDLADRTIAAKHTTDWPETKIFAFVTDFKKHRFLESFFINTNDNVMNSKTNDLLSTAYESAFGVKQPRTVVNKGFSEQSVSRSAVEIQRFLVGRVMTFDLQARVWFGHVFLITLLRMF